MTPVFGREIKLPRVKDADIKSLLDDFMAGKELVCNEPKEYLEELVMHVADGCNLSCTYCFADSGKYGDLKSNWMSPELARNAVVKICSEYKYVNRIKFFGGEPFLNVPAIEATINEFSFQFENGAISKKPTFNAISNMTTMTENTIELIRKFDIQITASLDGPSTINDLFRVYPNGRGSFDRINDGIRTLEAKTNQPSSIEVVYGPQHVLSKQSVVDMYKYMKSNYAIKTVVIHPMVKEPNVVETEGWQEYEEKLFSNFYDFGHYLVIEAATSSETTQVQFILNKFRKKKVVDAHCGLGTQTLTVNSSGKVYPCYTFMGDSDFEMGEINDRSLKQSHFIEIQNLFINNKRSSLDYCSSCDIQMVCQACPGAMLHTNRSHSSPIKEMCDYQSGFYQGFLKGLLELKSDSENWSTFLMNISTMPGIQVDAC